MFLFYIILWILSGVIGAIIGSSKDKVGLGFFLGLVLGLIGWIIIAIIPRDCGPVLPAYQRPNEAYRPPRQHNTLRVL